MSTRQKILAFLLVLCLLAPSLPVFGFADGIPAAKQAAHTADEAVAALVILDGAPAADAGEYDSPEARARREELAASHAAVLSAMDARGIEYRLTDEYFSLCNGFAVTVRYGDLAAIRRISGVRSANVSVRYEVPDTLPCETDASHSYGMNELTGADVLLEEGYNGKGTVIAVLDTGIYYDHRMFADYGLTDGVTEAEISALIEAGDVRPGTYYSAKIPFMYDYGDKDDDPIDRHGHGSHVSGIAAGYMEDEEGNVLYTGAAPCAQIVMMKVAEGFSHVISDTAILAALEDCYALDVDVINMSLGGTHGFAEDVDDEVFLSGIYDRLEAAGILLYAAAGNEYSMAYHTLDAAAQAAAQAIGQFGNLIYPAAYPDYGMIGSPATYAANTSVAAAFGKTAAQMGVICNGEGYAVSPSNISASFALTFAEGETPYVMIPGLGTDEDYAGIDAEGKVAVVKRGTINFQAKHDAAVAHGAIGLLIGNTDDDLISPSLSSAEIPVACMQKKGYDAFAANAVAGVGTFTVGRVVADTGKQGVMTEFSSYGPSSPYAFGPQITGIGGQVSSAGLDDPYAIVAMSGTSMASPDLAGNAATLLQYLSEKYPALSKTERTQLLESLLFSTANILIESSGAPYSPRKQGAGQVDIAAAAKAKARILSPLVAAGDNAEGTFTFTLRLENMTDEEQTYALASFFSADTVVSVDDEGNACVALTANVLGAGTDYLLTGAPAGNKVVLSAGATADVTLTLTLTQSAREGYFDPFFPNGAWIDGYILFFDPTDEENVIHASFLGFYGDWNAAPILEETADVFDYLDACYRLQNETDEDGNTPADLGLTEYDLMEGVTVGFHDVYVAGRYRLGDNPVGDAPVSRAHAVVSGTDGSLSVSPALLRNAGRLIALFRDAQTGKIYHLVDVENVRANIYFPELNDFLNTFEFSWDMTDDVNETEEEPAPLADGTVVDIELFAFPAAGEEKDFDGVTAYPDAEAFRDALLLRTGAPDFFLTVTVDDQAPVISSVELSREDLLLTCTDGNFLAGVELFDEEGEKVDEWIFSDETPGVSHEVRIEDGMVTGIYTLVLTDYALNKTTRLLISDETGHWHMFDPENGTCLFCDDVWSDGVYMATLSENPITEEPELSVWSNETLSSPADMTLTYPIRTLLSCAAEKNVGATVYMAFTDWATDVKVTFTAEAAAALAAQSTGALVFRYGEAENGVSFGWEWEDAALPEEGVTLSVFADTAAENARCYAVDEDGNYVSLPVARAEDGSAWTVEDPAYTRYLWTTPDAYGEWLESLKEEAQAARVAAEAAEANAEALKAQAEAAKIAAETAEKNAEALKAKAEAARAAAEAAEGNAEALKAQAEAASAAAEAAKAEAEALKAQAEAASAAAEEARVAAEKAKADALDLLARAAQARSDTETAKAEIEAARDTAEKTRLLCAVLCGVTVLAVAGAGVFLMFFRRRL